MARLLSNDKSEKMAYLFSLSRGPSQYVISFKSYIYNGFRFHIKDHEQDLRTQNSGVLVVVVNGIDAESIDYYEVLTEILEIQYLKGRRVVLIRCKWWDVHNREKGVKVDEYGVASVNF